MQINGYGDLVEIGRGAFSTVYRGSSERFSRDVAVKVFAGSMADPKLAAAFARECRLIGGLSGHPHVVTVHDSGLTDDQRPYIVMQYYTCGSLADVVARDGALSPGEVVAVAQAAGAALTVAHAAGIVHRDVKPHNLMLDQYGTVALGDFGIARPDDSHTTTLALTPAFAAPEVLTTGEAGPLSDLYSLAATLFWLLTGAAPHRMRPGEPELAYLNRRACAPADRLPATVPAPLAAAVEAGLTIHPADRPGSVAAFVEGLRGAALAAGVPVPFALTGHDRVADTVLTPGTAGVPAVSAPPAAPAVSSPPAAPAPQPPPAAPDQPFPAPDPALSTAPAGRGSAPPARPLPARPAAAGPIAAPTVPTPRRSRRGPVVAGAGALTMVLVAVAVWAGTQLRSDDGRIRTVAESSPGASTDRSAPASPTDAATGPGSPSGTSAGSEWVAGTGPASTAAGPTASSRSARPPVAGAAAATSLVVVTTSAGPRPAPTTAATAGGGAQQPAPTTAAPAPPPTVYEAIAQDGKTKPSFSNYQNFADRKDNIPGNEWIAISCQSIMSSPPPAGASYTSHWYRVADSRWAGRWIQTNSYHTRTRQGSTVTHTYKGDNSAEDWDHTVPLC